MRPDGLGPQLVCGVRDFDEETARMADEHARMLVDRVDPQKTASHVVPVYWHRTSVERDRGRGDRHADQPADHRAQQRVLGGRLLVLADGTDDTTNSTWYTCERRHHCRDGR